MARFASTVCVALLGGVQAWGDDGHAIVALLADDMVDPEVSKTLLADLGKESLADAATWCDRFDHSRAGEWSEALHYINYPGHACGFDWARDCKKDWCNVGAISNFTNQVWDKKLPADQRLMALEFMIHMMGDVHQPLHVGSADDRGGNDIEIHFKFTDSGERKKDNLHAVWDSAIIEQMIKDLEGTSLTSPPFHNYKILAADLLKRAKGDWAADISKWRKTVAENHDLAELRQGLTEVAEESAVLSCSAAYVNVNGDRIKKGDELDVQYYKDRKPVVAKQLSKAGARLAQLLSDSLAASRRDAKVLFV